MEDEDVDGINTLSVSANKADGDIVDDTLGVKKDVKKPFLPDNNSSSLNEEETEQSEENGSISRLKHSLVNHDLDVCNEKEASPNSLLDTSPQKVNGEVDKSSAEPLEESCDNDGPVSEVEKNCNNEDEVKKGDDDGGSERSSKRKRSSSESSAESNISDEDCDGGSSSDSSPFEFRGFKRKKRYEIEKKKMLSICEVKRRLESAQNSLTEELKKLSSPIEVPNKPKSPDVRRSARNVSISKKYSNDDETCTELKIESGGDQLTEYAQYLGLQPTLKFKCGRCGEKHFQTMASLNAHQMVCCKAGSNTITKQVKPTSDTSSSTNFRITRKVYLCSACGTYYENWKLFLHMRDMHKRHICLFCLGMFSVAERLAEHLLFQHNVHEKTCKSPEEFLNLFKGSCYLTCCSCEKMFTEREDFYDHQCKDPAPASTPNWSNDPSTLTAKDIKELAQKCTLCGVKCGHFRTCPKMAHKFQNMSTSSAVGTNTSNSSNLSLEKYYIPVPANVQKNWTPGSINQDILKQALSLPPTDKDYYDVSSAASFCHVDMANDSDNQSSPEKIPIEKTNDDRKIPCKLDSCKSPPILSNDETDKAEDVPQQEDDSHRINDKSLTNNKCNSVSDDDSDNSDSSTHDLKIDEKKADEIMERISDHADKSSIDEETPVEDISARSANSPKEAQQLDHEKPNEAQRLDHEKPNEAQRLDHEKPNEVQRLDHEKPNETQRLDHENPNETQRLDHEKLNEAQQLDHEDPKEAQRLDHENPVKENVETNPEKPNSFTAEKKYNISPSFVKLERMDDSILHNCSHSTTEDISQSDACSDSNSSRSSMEADNTDSIEENVSSNDSTNQDDEDVNMKEVTTAITNADNDESVSEKDQNVTEKTDGIELNKEIKPCVLTNDKNDSTSEDQAVSSEAKKDENVVNKEKPAVLSGDEHHEDEQKPNSTIENEKSVDVAKIDDNSSLDVDVQNRQPEVNGDGIVNDTVDESKNGSEEMDVEPQIDKVPSKELYFKCDDVTIQLASEEVMAMALTLEDKMESLSSKSVIKECVRTSCTTCSYCSHAIKIGVNGKQLAIHLLTEHRYMPVKNETVEDVIERLKNSLAELQDVWFNTDSYDSSEKSCFVPYDHMYECFQCNYVTNTHKDLFSHKRKVHQKTILYCSMCKENFYSYSELLCHMCSGLYDATKDINFRCCLCDSDRIPSAFRLMVHLRKTHNTCDICLETADDQQRLSAHMVKHKLHHLCYRCGIAYRNKPDITKHLFWKHGTESIMCKRCLQKKWPHVYHFCVPPPYFTCDECHISFSKAVFLKVHRRFHDSNLPYACATCEQRFVSKKLLGKHEKSHDTAVAEVEKPVEKENTSIVEEDAEKSVEQNDTKCAETTIASQDEPAVSTEQVEKTEKSEENTIRLHKKKSRKDKDKKIKPVVDVYDLPPLNLSSESDDTDDEKEAKPVQQTTNVENNEKDLTVKKEDVSDSDKQMEIVDNATVDKLPEIVPEVKTAEPNVTESMDVDETTQPVTVVDGIWDNFHTYKAEQEKRENLDNANKESLASQTDSQPSPDSIKDAVLGDHDYCKPIVETAVCSEVVEESKPKEHSSSIDHDYCTQNSSAINNSSINSSGVLNTSAQSENTDTPSKKKQKSPKKNKQSKQRNSSSSSDSSSDSDSSSCSCGTNCSCTSSSSNSSSSCSSDSDSSSSDGKHNSNSKRERKKEKLKSKRKGELAKSTDAPPPVEEHVVNVSVEPEEPLIRESDLDTDESVTDEEFYDKYPQMRANQILAEKRNQLMVLATVAPTVNNGAVSPPVPNSTPTSTNINLDPASSPKLEIVTPPVTPTVPPLNKRKLKAKKRRKSSFGAANKSRSKQHSATPVYETPQPSTSFSSPLWQPPSAHIRKMPNDGMYMQHTNPTTHVDTTEIYSTPQVSNRQKGAAGMDSSKRSSKRRRVRNKFYGYSSDEDGEHHVHPPIKWKKLGPGETSGKHNLVQMQQPYSQPYQQPMNVVEPEYNHTYQHQPLTPKVVLHQQNTHRPMFHENQTIESTMAKRPIPPASSSSGSDDDSDSDNDRLAISQEVSAPNIMPSGLHMGTSEKDDKLYCYCQCPYDEVSEMIACDGIDCAIEWFHFECVGIMVPPKGKWYCPDCRKRRGLS